MKISKRFDIDTDDLSQLPDDIDQTYTCNTCGAIIRFPDLLLHHDWHEDISKEITNIEIHFDDKTLCANCGHFEMNHANYMNWPRACNQTHCECREYIAPNHTLICKLNKDKL